MTDASLPRPIVILAPTAGGKSELAVDLAKTLGGQIIGADSMQVYRHMDAGTAKPSLKWRRQIKHHLIDIVEPTERFTVADWFQQADRLIGAIQRSKHHPIVVGGTNLYIKALLEGLFSGPPADPELRHELAQCTGQQLHQRLQEVDPEAAQRIHPNDHKKLVRALEVYHTTGQRISDLQVQWTDGPSTDDPYRHDSLLVGLDWPVADINRRINQRVQGMFYPEKAAQTTSNARGLDHDKEGERPTESLPDEAKRLQEQGLLGPQAREALGYKQVLESLEGQYSLDDAFERTKILTRRFAKNQRTWLRRFRSVAWFSMADQGLADIRDEIMNFVS